MRLVHGHSASVGRLTSTTKACRILAADSLKTNSYAAFLCPALAFAHRARCAAAIFLRPEADMVRLTFAEAVVFVAPVTEFDFSRPSPIWPFAPSPFSVVKPPILFASVG